MEAIIIADLGMGKAGSRSGAALRTFQGRVFEFEQVHDLEVLGTTLDAGGRTAPNVHFRLREVEKLFFGYQGQLKSLASVANTLEVFYAAIGGCALYGCSEWAVNTPALQTLQTWEYKLLRKVFTFKCSMSRQGYMQTPASHMGRIRNTSATTLCTQTAQAVFQASVHC